MAKKTHKLCFECHDTGLIIRNRLIEPGMFDPHTTTDPLPTTRWKKYLVICHYCDAYDRRAKEAPCKNT